MILFLIVQLQSLDGLWPSLSFIILLVAAVVALAGLMATSITERRWEAQQPILVSQNIGQFESDNAKWGADYPREFDAY